MKKRLITSLLITLVIFPLILLGKIPFLVGVILLTATFLYEVSKQAKVSIFFIIPLILFSLFFTFFDMDNILESFLNYPIYYPILLILISYLYLLFDKKADVNKINYLIVMHFFISLVGRGLLFLRNLNGANANVILFLFILTFITDSFAYLIGSKFGKRKLHPRISPKKTIEGSIGGIIFGTAFGVLIGYLFPLFSNNNLTPFLGLGVNLNGPFLDYGKVIILSFSLTIFAQLGDLMFSTIKRQFEIKDFGNILPGHGGIADRFDSVSYNVIVVSLIYIMLTTLF